MEARVQAVVVWWARWNTDTAVTLRPALGDALSVLPTGKQYGMFVSQSH